MEYRRLRFKGLVLAALLVALVGLYLMPMLATAATPKAKMASGSKAALPGLTISMTSKGITVVPSSIKGGDYRVTIKNGTKEARGVEMLGVDKATSPTVRYTKILKPGKMEAFRWYFASGKTTYVRDLLSCTHDQRSCVVATFGQMSKAITVK